MIKPTTVILAAILLLGPLLVAEMGTRALIASGRLPTAPTSNTEADVSLANIARLGRPDVLVLGTSSIRSALRPDTLAKLLSDRIGREVSVQSVAQPSLSLGGQRLIARGLAEQDLLPELIVLGLTPSTMTGYGPAGDWFDQSELGRLWGGCEDVEGPDGMICRLGQLSALWRWRGRADRVAESLVEGMPRTTGDADRRLTESGWLSEQAVDKLSLEDRVPLALDVLPRDPILSAENEAEFVALIEDLRSYGAEVVAVALPYAPQLEAALVKRNPDWRIQRDAGYAALAEAAAVPILEVAGYGSWWSETSQNDLRHLSRSGAGPLTRQLWSMRAFREPLLDGLASAD